jgi:hypothetical protein
MVAISAAIFAQRFACGLLARQLRFLLFQLVRHFGHVGAGFRRQLLQAFLLFEQAFQRFDLAVDLGEAAGQDGAFLFQQGFLLLRFGQRALLGRQRLALFGQLAVDLRQRFALLRAGRG